MTETVSEFVHSLRELRTQAGAPSYRVLEKRTGIPRATLHDALRGNRLPALDTTLKIVTACGGEETPWRTRWCTVHDASTARGPRDSDEHAGTPAPRWRRLGTRTRLAVGAAAVIVVGVPVALLATRTEPAPDQSGCLREYTVTQKGSILDRETHVIGEVQPGERVRVRSLDHGPYRARYEVFAPRTGKTGYVNTANLHYVTTVCS